VEKRCSRSDETTRECPPRGPWWAWAAPVFGLLWLALPGVDFTGSDPTPWQWGVAGAGLLAFGSVFLQVVMTRRPLLVPVAATLAISAALTLAAHDSFALMFVYAASAAAVRLPARDGALAVAGVTALAAATLALTDPESALFWGVTGTVLATGTLWFLIGGLVRANAELREARAELASKLLPARAEQAATQVADIRALSRSALTQVREAVDGYRRPTLPSELAGARVALEKAGIGLRVDTPGEPLDPEVESVLALRPSSRSPTTGAARGARTEPGRARVTGLPG
jgi:two-component system, NarL family, sensor histidine kinase DesK